MQTFSRKQITPAALVVLVSLALSANVPAEQFSWQKNYAKITPEGDLQWAPEPFVFKAGDSPRYIDYENGSDSNPGTRAAPFKHHPWDSQAGGNAAKCSGIHTYVFKRGVVYRGKLIADESGAAGNPVRLTSETSWGQGEAAVYGSVRITDGWKKCDAATAPKTPEPEKIWYKDIPKPQPRCLWEMRDGKILRVNLARTPNWTVSNPDDVKSEWWEWLNGKKVGERVEAADPKNLINPDSNYYVGATVWTEWVGVMGTPYPTPVEKYDPEEHTLTFEGFWAGNSTNPIQYCRYYLENKLQYLDEPGEFYYESKGSKSGRLYVRLSGDRNPNDTIIEAARWLTLIDIRNQSHIEITGLTFRFENVWNWPDRWFVNENVLPACVRMLGSCSDIRIANCTFEHVAKAVRAKAVGDNDFMTDIVVSDNLIAHTDHGAIHIQDGSAYGKKNPPIGRLGRVAVLRNRLVDIGTRPARSEQCPAVNVNFASQCEVAGNILDRCYGPGLFIFGGKPSGQLTHRPLSRVLIHNNKVTNPLLNTNDWGGIESWQGGSTYVFDNISGNPGGYWHWKHMFNRNNPKREHTTARFGFAYYLDGAFKQYLFNNIAWGKSNDLTSPLCNTAALQEIIGFQNAFFNNTFYKFACGSRRQVPNAGRNCYLGNLWMDISEMYFRHSDAKAKDENMYQIAGIVTKGRPYACDSLAYADNVFYGKPRHFGLFESEGILRNTLETFSGALKAKHALAGRTGFVAGVNPVRNAAAHDFRPAENSPVIDRGVKFFVPWALYAVVGEWNFYKNNADATKILGENWFMTDEYVSRGMYRFIPRNDLTAQNVSAGDYVKGRLENWTEGALTFNGKDQFCILKDADVKSSYSYKQRNTEHTYPGSKRQTVDMDSNNFLIEIYFSGAPGRTAGTLVLKMAEAGYSLAIEDTGRAKMTVRADGQNKNQCSRTSSAVVSDGKWHHLIAEIDRTGPQPINVYIDGKLSNGPLTGTMPAGGVSIANNADLLVGKAPAGDYFAGAIDFLRISRGSLADAKTTIEELYEWQFNGPFLKDFFGNEPAGKNRDAGAIEYRRQ